LPEFFVEKFGASNISGSLDYVLTRYIVVTPQTTIRFLYAFGS